MTRNVALGDELYLRKQGVITGLTNAKNGYLLAGKNLMVIKQKRLWQAEGNHSKSFAHWVENELGISKATAYQMIDVYDRLGDLLVHKDFAEIDYSKAILVATALKDNATLEEKEEMLYLAKAQSVRGLKDNLKNLRGELGSDQCSHQGHEQEAWNKCRCCGHFWR